MDSDTMQGSGGNHDKKHEHTKKAISAQGSQATASTSHAFNHPGVSGLRWDPTQAGPSTSGSQRKTSTSHNFNQPGLFQLGWDPAHAGPLMAFSQRKTSPSQDFNQPGPSGLVWNQVQAGPSTSGSQRKTSPSQDFNQTDPSGLVWNQVQAGPSTSGSQRKTSPIQDFNQPGPSGLVWDQVQAGPSTSGSQRKTSPSQDFNQPGLSRLVWDQVQAGPSTSGSQRKTSPILDFNQPGPSGLVWDQAQAGPSTSGSQRKTSPSFDFNQPGPSGLGWDPTQAGPSTSGSQRKASPSFDLNQPGPSELGWAHAEAGPSTSGSQRNSSTSHDIDQPGPSGLGLDPGQTEASTSSTGMVTGGDQDRSQASSPSYESSLGDSRSPDVLWRDSCVSDMSESSPDSANCSTTSPKDTSNGSGVNGHSSSGMNSDHEKQEKISQATFNKVLIDANQRRQIRNKVRNIGTDSGSDSSSGNMGIDMPQVAGTPADNTKSDSTTSDSSGIGVNFLASTKCDHFTLPRSTMMQSGVTNSSTGVSTMYNSTGVKESNESKQDSVSSGGSVNRKRHIPWSIARYYYQTKRPTTVSDAPVGEEEGDMDLGTGSSKRPAGQDRKRKRFHRTFTALRQCGLLDLTMQTASLMEQNTKLQKQLGELHRQAHLMYHTVSHFSKIQPGAFVSPEAQRVMDGLKEMVDKNPVGAIDMSVFESTSRESNAFDSGAFTLSNLPPTFSLNSAGNTAVTNVSQNCSDPNLSDPKISTDSAIQSSEPSVTTSSSDKSGRE